MKFQFKSETLFNAVVSFASSLAGYFLGIFSFPDLYNKSLYQAAINYKSLTIITVTILFLIFLFIALRYSSRRYATGYWMSGVVTCILLFAFTFFVYFPYENRNVISAVKCDSTGNARFLIGSKMRPDFMAQNPAATLADKLTLINGANCNPGLIWTQESIEKNYALLILNYLTCLALFTCVIFSLLQAVLCQIAQKSV